MTHNHIWTLLIQRKSSSLWNSHNITSLNFLERWSWGTIFNVFNFLIKSLIDLWWTFIILPKANFFKVYLRLIINFVAYLKIMIQDWISFCNNKSVGCNIHVEISRYSVIIDFYALVPALHWLIGWRVDFVSAALPLQNLIKIFFVLFWTFRRNAFRCQLLFEDFFLSSFLAKVHTNDVQQIFVFIH